MLLALPQLPLSQSVIDLMCVCVCEFIVRTCYATDENSQVKVMLFKTFDHQKMMYNVYMTETEHVSQNYIAYAGMLFSMFKYGR